MNDKYRNPVSRLVAWMCLAAGLLGLLMRYTVKDRVPALAVVFYALPPLAVTMLFAGAFALNLRRPRKSPRAVASALLTGIALLAWIQTDFVWADATPTEGQRLRVALWNLARPAPDDASFVPILYETDAQIVFLVESGGSPETRRPFWESHFPDYHVSLLAGQMVLLSRYPIATTRRTTVDGRTAVAEFDLLLPDRALSLIGVDVVSAHCSRRRFSLEQISAIAAAKRSPVIALGDFNIPHTSILFDELRRSFHHAFEESGSGLITTWPSLFPVLALDHIWLSDGLASVRTVLWRTRHSDHALVMTDVVLPDPQHEPDRAEVSAL